MCVLVSDNLVGKLVAVELLNIFDDILRVTPVAFAVADFNLWSCDFDNFTFILLYLVIWYWCCIINKIIK